MIAAALKAARSGPAQERALALLAVGFPAGALLHLGWVVYHGDFFYHGPAPAWAVWFWYGLCVVDVAVFAILVRWPRPGLVFANATMATTMAVNWTQFPTFEYQFNYVLLGLTAFALFTFAITPWLWRAFGPSPRPQPSSPSRSPGPPAPHP